jgi:Flp pilus assembly CpaF family ATPase
MSSPNGRPLAPVVVVPTVAGAGNVALVTALRPQVAARLDTASPNGRRDARWQQTVERAVVDVLREHARQALAAGRPPLGRAVEAQVARALRAEFTGAGSLQALLDNDEIETIHINGYRDVWAERSDGTATREAPVAASDDDLVALLRELGARSGAQERRFSPDAPELSLQLLDRDGDAEPDGGARLHAIMDITDRVAVTIRRHRLLRVSLEDLVRMGTLTPGLRDVLAAMVRAHRNIVVSGGPAAGKTTMLRALASQIPPHERIIVAEDTRELSLPKAEHPNLLSMQARLPNSEGIGEFTLDDCVRASLRMGPKRVLVGEVRGAEVTSMAKAMSIGAPGSMATVHAEDSVQTILRMITYAMEPPAGYTYHAATTLIAGSVHLVVHMEKLDIAAGGVRVVSSIREIVGDDGGQVLSNEVFRPGADKRAVPASRFSDKTLDLLVAQGLSPQALDQRWRLT